MRRVVTYALILTACFLLQTTFVGIGRIFAAAPNLMLVVTVSAGYLGGRKCGMAAGFFAGLAMDLYQGHMAGMYALLFVVCGYFAGGFCQIYFESSARMPALITGACDAVCGFVTYVIKFFLRGRIHFLGYLRNVIFPEVVITMLSAVVLYHIIYRIEEGFVRKKKSRKATTWLKG